MISPNLVGKRFGRLLVIRRKENDKYRNSRWLCKCDCHNEIITYGYSLKRGFTKSCGCLQKERTKITHTTHEHSYSPTYYVWRSMIQRCTNKKHKSYKDYGERKIKVCYRWSNKKNGFLNFLKDMGEKPDKKQLDRTDNNLGYYKKNCMWVTSKVNNRNRRDNRLYYYDNKFQCISAWSEDYSIRPDTLKYRLDNGYSIEKALTTPVRKQRRKNG